MSVKFSVENLAAILDEMGKSYERKGKNCICLVERYSNVPWTLDVAFVFDDEEILTCGARTLERAVQTQRRAMALRAVNNWNLNAVYPTLSLEEKGTLRADAPVYRPGAASNDAESWEHWVCLFFEGIKMCFNELAKKLA